MSTPTPGTYLRLRREAAGLSIDDLALRIDTWPQTCMRYRADLIASIEADDVPMSPGTAVALRYAFCFDPIVLDHLAAIHAGSFVAPPHLCRACACSWHDPCHDASRIGRCGWSREDPGLCTACAAKPTTIAAAPSADVLDLAEYRVTAGASEAGAVG